MKILAAVIARIVPKRPDEPDLFDKRLEKLAKPAPRAYGRQAGAAGVPVLFRRELGHA